MAKKAKKVRKNKILCIVVHLQGGLIWIYVEAYYNTPLRNILAQAQLLSMKGRQVKGQAPYINSPEGEIKIV